MIGVFPAAYQLYADCALVKSDVELNVNAITFPVLPHSFQLVPS